MSSKSRMPFHKIAPFLFIGIGVAAAAGMVVLGMGGKLDKEMKGATGDLARYRDKLDSSAVDKEKVGEFSKIQAGDQETLPKAISPYKLAFTPDYPVKVVSLPPAPAEKDLKQEKFDQYDKSPKDGFLSYAEFKDSGFNRMAGTDKRIDIAEIDEDKLNKGPDGDPKGISDPEKKGPEVCLIAPMAVDAEGYDAAIVNIVYWQPATPGANQLPATEVAYFVYRAEPGADGKPGAWKLLTPEPLTAEQYQDAEVDEGVSYFYAVAQASKDPKITKSPGKEGEYNTSDKTACPNSASVISSKLDWRFVMAKSKGTGEDKTYEAQVKLRQWYRDTTSKPKGPWLRLTLDLTLPSDSFMGGNYFVSDLLNGKVSGMDCKLVVETYDGNGALTKLEAKDAKTAIKAARIDFSTGLKWGGTNNEIAFERNGKTEKFTEAERRHTPDWDKLKAPRGPNFPPPPDNK